MDWIVPAAVADNPRPCWSVLISTGEKFCEAIPTPKSAEKVPRIVRTPVLPRTWGSTMSVDDNATSTALFMIDLIPTFAEKSRRRSHGAWRS
jgi:hypothetical protein